MTDRYDDENGLLRIGMNKKGGAYRRYAYDWLMMTIQMQNRSLNVRAFVHCP